MLRQVLAALLLLVAVPAQAVVVDVVVRGNVCILTDIASGRANVFGDSLVSGAAYTARFVYDTTLGERRSIASGLPVDRLFGASDNIYGMPFQASLTIGGVRHNILGASSLPIARQSGSASLVPRERDPVFPPDEGIDIGNPKPNLATYGVESESRDASFAVSEYDRLNFIFEGALETFPNNLETSFTVGFRPNPNNQSNIPGGFGTWGSGFQDRTAGTFGFIGASLGVSRLTVKARTEVSAVPLPASLLLLVAALGCLGLIRGRRAPDHIAA